MSEPTATTIWAVIAGMALINFVVRFVPLALLSRFEMPPTAKRWLSYIPISVMGALVASEVLRPGNEWQSPISSASVYAAALTMLVFRFSRSFLGATVAGMISYVAIRALLG